MDNKYTKQITRTHLFARIEATQLLPIPEQAKDDEMESADDKSESNKRDQE